MILHRRLHFRSTGPAEVRAFSVATGTTGDVVLAKPTGVVDGDILLTFFTCRDRQPSTLSGWTRLHIIDVSSGDICAAYYKIASSDGDYFTWSLTTGAVPEFAAVMVAIQNATPTGILSASAKTTYDAASLDAGSGGVLITHHGQYYSASSFAYNSPPTGMTKVTNVAVSTTACGFVVSKLPVEAGATGTKTVTGSSTAYAHATSVFVPSA